MASGQKTEGRPLGIPQVASTLISGSLNYQLSKAGFDTSPRRLVRVIPEIADLFSKIFAIGSVGGLGLNAGQVVDRIVLNGNPTRPGWMMPGTASTTAGGNSTAGRPWIDPWRPVKGMAGLFLPELWKVRVHRNPVTTSTESKLGRKGAVVVDFPLLDVIVNHHNCGYFVVAHTANATRRTMVENNARPKWRTDPMIRQYREIRYGNDRFVLECGYLTPAQAILALGPHHVNPSEKLFLIQFGYADAFLDGGGIAERLMNTLRENPADTSIDLGWGSWKFGDFNGKLAIAAAALLDSVIPQMYNVICDVLPSDVLRAVTEDNDYQGPDFFSLVAQLQAVSPYGTWFGAIKELVTKALKSSSHDVLLDDLSFPEDLGNILTQLSPGIVTMLRASAISSSVNAD